MSEPITDEELAAQGHPTEAEMVTLLDEFELTCGECGSHVIVPALIAALRASRAEVERLRAERCRGSGTRLDDILLSDDMERLEDEAQVPGRYHFTVSGDQSPCPGPAASG